MSDPTDGAPSSSGSGLPPHLDPRRPRAATSVPKVTASYRDSARASSTVIPPPRRTRGRRVGRVLSWIALALSLVVLGTAGVGYALVNHYNGQINRLPGFTGLAGHAQPPKAPRNAANYLLVGSDSRVGASGVGTQGTGAEFVTGQRSDTVILVHLFGNSDKAQLVSFPRDSYVEIPAYTDPKTHRTTPAHHNKLNSAFGLGGPPLLIATIEQLTNIRIDHFLQVNFAGFKGMVNKLGGVDVCLTKAAKEKDSGIDLSAGTHHIDGDMALSFVRQRKNLPNGDIDRITRQQQFIGAMVRKVLSAGTLLNPFKLNGFLDVATSSLTVDQDLSVGNLRDLALRLRSFQAGGVIFTTVPIADIGGFRTGAGAVVLLDQAKDTALFELLRRDQAPGTPAPAAPAVAAAGPTTVPVAPSQVRVSVFNGSGVSGLGRKAATDLAAAGFQVIGAAQTRGTGATQTMVLFGPTRADSAKTLAASLAGSVLVADPSLGRTVQVVLGSSYTGVSKVTVAAPVPSSAPAPAAAPPVSTAANTTCTA